MTSRIVEAKIILLIWLFSASVVSYSAVSIALAIHSDALAFTNIAQEQTGEAIEPENASNSSQPRVMEGNG
jgi:hypothetical protein